jgi:hypothetical protein
MGTKPGGLELIQHGLVAHPLEVELVRTSEADLKTPDLDILSFPGSLNLEVLRANLFLLNRGHSRTYL